MGTLHMTQTAEIVAPETGEAVEFTLGRAADEINTEIARMREAGNEAMERAFRVGEMLLQVKARLPHGTFMSWVEHNLECSDRMARNLLRIAKTATRCHFDADTSIRAALKQIEGPNVRGTQGTGENEWYTPDEHLELVRQVLGTIELDPASSENANRIVKAQHYFDQEDDALTRDWHGKVWLNPPYAQPLIQQFVEKLVAEYTGNRVTEAILLTHNYTDTNWFHTAASAAAATCFTRGRIKFYQPDGTIAAPTQGQAFSYFGENVNKFAEVFEPIGFVVTPWMT